INIADDNGITPLYQRTGSVVICATKKKLLSNRADPNKRSGKDYTRFHHALRCMYLDGKRERDEIVWLLLDNGANVNIENICRTTPLIYAIHTRNISIVFADVNAGNRNRLTVLQCCIVVHGPKCKGEYEYVNQMWC
ncbi:hypothetical protein CAPTEDRAFT_134388, partial [Capitella teleta]